MKKQHTKGFTLVELLVASGVTAIIVGLMITMVNNLLTAYNRSSGSLAAQSQAGLVMEQLSAELESMVLRNSDDFMFVVEQVGQLPDAGKDSPDEIEVHSPDKIEIPGADSTVLPPIEDYRFGQGGLWLKFFTSAPTLTGDSASGVRAIGYRIDYNPVVPGSSVSSYMLYRTQIPAQVTFDWGYDLTSAAYNQARYTFRNDDGDPVTEFNGLQRPNPALEELPQQIIADNVIDFGVRLYTVDENGQRELKFPTSADQNYAASGSSDTDAYPQVVEVMIRILTPEGRRLIEAIDDDNLDLDWWEVAEQNSQVFSKVIKIPSQAL